MQALIILDFLLSFTKAGKERMSAVPRSNRSMMYSDELNDEDVGRHGPNSVVDWPANVSVG